MIHYTYSLRELRDVPTWAPEEEEEEGCTVGWPVAAERILSIYAKEKDVKLLLSENTVGSYLFYAVHYYTLALLRELLQTLYHHSIVFTGDSNIQHELTQLEYLLYAGKLGDIGEVDV
jgi:hypothetical protein